jgi:hypothetical protein
VLSREKSIEESAIEDGCVHDALDSFEDGVSQQQRKSRETILNTKQELEFMVSFNITGKAIAGEEIYVKNESEFLR